MFKMTHRTWNVRYTVIVIFLALLPSSMQISTVHHDKPEDTKIPRMATKMLDIPENKNITASERRKRLLPYVNFYIDQNNNNNYNQPSNYPNYITQQSPEQIPLKNYNEFTRPQIDANQHYYQDKNVYTPFLESNALSGSFSPMIRSRPQKVRLDYVKLSQRPKTPNFSAIYDKLSQLKLAEQSRPLAFNQNYRNPQHNVANLKPQVNYISIQDYRPQKYKTFPEAKPILRTYSPTIVDIQTSSDVDYVNENYRQIPVSIKQIGNVDPKKLVDQGKQEIAVGLSRPNYIAGQGQEPQYGQKIKQPLHQQIFIIQKPLVAPHKYYQNDEKHHYQGLQPIQQPSNYILPNPIHINKHYSYQGVNHDGNIEKYVPAPSYEPLQIENPVESYEYYPQKISSTDRYEFTTAGRPTEAPIIPTEAPILPTENTNTLSLILKKLQDSNALPHTFTPDNIDNSIRTLVKILNGLKKQQKLTNPIVVADENGDYLNPEVENGADIEINDDPEPIVDTITQVFPDNTLDGGTPGKPGIDYPQLSTIPPTSFNCKTQRYKGFFGDPDTLCQVWHYCDLNGGQASFLCPNGTIFSQVALTCDWWYNVKCSSTTQLYVLNERLYKYILPLSPKFPEDYSGPLVDKYLALKFQEMEEKMERERKGKVDSDSKEATESEELENEEDGEDTNTEKPET